MFEAAVEWAKEYGDVLGTIGFLFALSTIIITNGRVIIMRLRGQPITPSSTPSVEPTGKAAINISLSVTDYGNRTPIAVVTPRLLGEVEHHFSEGLAEDMITDLQRLGFAVPDIRTVNILLSEDPNLQSLAQQLKLSHVLTSSVRRQEDRVRISVQLVAKTGAVVWSERFDAQGSDMMAIQADTAEKIAAQVSQIIKPKDVIIDASSGRAFATKEQAMRVVGSPKSRLKALLLCAPIVGIFGAHRFYVGRPWTGLLYFCTIGLLLFGWLIDCVLIALGMFADGKSRPVIFWRPDPEPPQIQSQSKT